MNQSTARLHAQGNHRFLAGLVALTVFAWLLREYFVAVTVVESPLRGDIRQYVAYAWNVLHHGTFSQVWPGTGDPVPDSFRGPGYPVFLAGLMWFDPYDWYQLALHAQAVFGALTATMTVLLARHWLPAAWTFVAGTLVAVWPHHVAATGALLIEVLFGFLLMLALLLAAEAFKRRSTGWAASSGLAFSAAALTSMVSLLFPAILAVMLKRLSLATATAAMLATAVAGPAAWSLRGTAVDTPPAQPGRMTMNLVQGSWPLYHRAYASRNAHPVPRRIIDSIDAEIALLAKDPWQGAAAIWERIAADPVRYLRWYTIEKPYLLWDWEIRLRAGPDGIYFHDVRHSPLETQPLLHAIKTALQYTNPFIFWVSAAGCLGVALRWWFGAKSESAAAVAFFCIYATLVHVVFQAEPRYAIAYRPMQLLMLVTALAWLASWIRKRAPSAVANL